MITIIIRIEEKHYDKCKSKLQSNHYDSKQKKKKKIDVLHLGGSCRTFSRMTQRKFIYSGAIVIDHVVVLHPF